MVLSNLFHYSYYKYNPNGITVGFDFVKICTTHVAAVNKTLKNFFPSFFTHYKFLCDKILGRITVKTVISTKLLVKCGTALWPLLIQSKGTVYKILTTLPLTSHDYSDIHVTPWPPRYIMFHRHLSVPCCSLCKG